ncbi:signal peptidase I [Enterococcus larvae]|uniref:signal peptidase I n=1 Tax=Enterococcus larvae TaxID=2794352 RepID=UPI003F2B5606
MTKGQKRKKTRQRQQKQSEKLSAVQKRSVGNVEKNAQKNTEQPSKRKNAANPQSKKKGKRRSSKNKRSQSLQRQPKRKKPRQRLSSKKSQPRINKLASSFKKQSKTRLFGKRKSKRRKRIFFTGVRRGVHDFLAVLLVMALASLAISTLFFGVEKVNGYSMMPTLTDGDTVFIRKSKDVERMDMVLFQRGQVQQIRRVIGLPGERIYYSDDVLYVNGEAVDEKFIINEINEAQKNGGQYTGDFQLLAISGAQVVPDKCYLVLADNREYGSDSREYGLITSEQIIGIVKARLLPLNVLTGF